MRAVSILCCFVVVLAAPGAGATLSITGLGHLPSGFIVTSSANEVSADGSVVFGQSSSDPLGLQAFRWTADDGMVALGRITVNGVSADGSVVVGDTGASAYLWTAGGGMIGLGDLAGGGTGSSAHGVSADGTTVVGTGSSASGTEAFRWTAGEGMVGLGDLAGGSFLSEAYAISSDGSIIVGFSNSAAGSEAFRWSAGGGMIGLGDLDGGVFGAIALATSFDGSVVVGWGQSASGVEAFRWTAENGMVGLGSLPGSTDSFANGVSGDGSLVVGEVREEQAAFIWDATHGMRFLKDVLVNDYGIDLTGWRSLDAAYAISSDGRAIVGRGTRTNGVGEAWLATIPEPSTGLLLAFGLAGLALRRRFAS